MLTLLTGGPCSGKTAWLVDQIFNNSGYNGRSIYVHNECLSDYRISDNVISLDDAKSWFSLPSGSVVIFEDADYSFPCRSRDAFCPRWVNLFSVPSYNGIDVFMTSQNAMKIDKDVRSYLGRHLHFVRDFGFKPVFDCSKYRNDNVVSISRRQSALF